MTIKCVSLSFWMNRLECVSCLIKVLTSALEKLLVHYQFILSEVNLPLTCNEEFIWFLFDTNSFSYYWDEIDDNVCNWCISELCKHTSSIYTFNSRWRLSFLINLHQIKQYLLKKNRFYLWYIQVHWKQFATIRSICLQ